MSKISMKLKRLRELSIGVKIFAAVFVLVVLFVMAYLVTELIVRPIDKATGIHTITGTVTEKTTKNVGKTGMYLVFVEDENGTVWPYEVTDSLFRWRFNSADVYGNIREGQKYVFEVGGSRWDLLSWYPNIYSYREIE